MIFYSVRSGSKILGCNHIRNVHNDQQSSFLIIFVEKLFSTEILQSRNYPVLTYVLKLTKICLSVNTLLHCHAHQVYLCLLPGLGFSKSLPIDSLTTLQVFHHSQSSWSLNTHNQGSSHFSKSALILSCFFSLSSLGFCRNSL